MRNFDIIKAVYEITKEEDYKSVWERDGTEQLEKIQKLIEHRRPLQFPPKQNKKLN